MPPGEEVVPGPMEEDGPPAQVTVEDVTPVPEDQQSQGMVVLELRSRIFHCQLLSSDIKSGKDTFFPSAEMILNVMLLFSQRGAEVPRFNPWSQVLPVLQRAKESYHCRGWDRNPQGWRTKCLHSDVHDITVLSLRSTVGVLSKTFFWGPLGFHHKPKTPQGSAAPGSARQRALHARLGGRAQNFYGVFASSTLHLSLHGFPSVFAAVVSDSSIFQTSRFVWLDGSSWTYADWLPGRPKRTSSFDNCVELLGRTEATP